MLGVFLASSAALIANIYFKISMHAIGLGGWLGIFLVIAGTNSMLMTWPVASVLLITGLVCSSRLLVSDHSTEDIYAFGVVCRYHYTGYSINRHSCKMKKPRPISGLFVVL